MPASAAPEPDAPEFEKRRKIPESLKALKGQNCLRPRVDGCSGRNREVEHQLARSRRREVSLLALAGHLNACCFRSPNKKKSKNFVVK